MKILTTSLTALFLLLSITFVQAKPTVIYNAIGQRMAVERFDDKIHISVLNANGIVSSAIFDASQAADLKRLIRRGIMHSLNMPRSASQEVGRLSEFIIVSTLPAGSPCPSACEGIIINDAVYIVTSLREYDKICDALRASEKR